jgi:hypothetical protein
MKLFKDSNSASKTSRQLMSPVEWNGTKYETAKKRARQSNTHFIIDWFDNVWRGMSKTVDDYRKIGDRAALDEIRDTLSQLMALTEELYIRDEEFHNIP